MIGSATRRSRSKIAKLLDKQCYLIDAIMAKSRQSIGILSEHRTALISAAVTGKIDVRGWQKPATEPEETATAASA